MKIWENLDFEYEEGKKPPRELTLFALSTCGFCKSALRFLRRNQVAFKYLYLDKLELDTKKEVKQHGPAGLSRTEFHSLIPLIF